MIRHVVLFRFRAGLAADRGAAFDAAATALRENIPAISGLRAGPALALQPSPIDYVLLLDFEDPQRFHEYKEHPAHRAFIDQHVRPCVEETTRAQVEIV